MTTQCLTCGGRNIKAWTGQLQTKGVEMMEGTFILLHATHSTDGRTVACEGTAEQIQAYLDRRETCPADHFTAVNVFQYVPVCDKRPGFAFWK